LERNEIWGGERKKEKERIGKIKIYLSKLGI
jgi:hypothetical protein